MSFLSGQKIQFDAIQENPTYKLIISNNQKHLISVCYGDKTKQLECNLMRMYLDVFVLYLHNIKLYISSNY